MFHQSRRDQLALEPLLPFIDREITADPERRDPARRAARRQDVAQATLYFKNLRAEEEEKKDRELRARLNGVATPTHVPSHRIKQPAARPAVKADASTRRVHSDCSDERRRQLTHRTPLTPITSPNSTDATSTRPPVGRSSLSTTTRPTTAVEPITTVPASKGIPTSPDCRTSDVRRAGISPSAFQATLVAVTGPINVGKFESNSLHVLDATAEDLSGGAGPSSSRSRVVKPTQSHSKHLKQAARAPTSSVTASHSPITSRVAVTHGQGLLEPQPGASTLAAMNDARTCSISQHRGRTPICGLLHRRDFEVNRICRKLFVDQKIVFVVSWKSTWVPLKLVVEGNSSKYPYVDADGTRWYIRTTSGRRERDGIEEVKVRWMHTKEPVEMLSNAQGAIDAFETDLQLAGADEVAQVRQRRVLDIAESHFPRGSVLPQSEEDYNASQRWVSSLWPEIRPHRTLDLYPAIYRIYMELASRRHNKKHGGKSLRCLMKLPQLRPLRWSDDFLSSGASLTCSSRKRASIFIQVTGTAVARHCTRSARSRNDPHQSHRNIDTDENSQIQPQSSARPKATGHNYTPQPIEMDLLKLAFKYDHLEPLKRRTSKNGVFASTSTAADQTPRHANTAVDQMTQHMSVLNKHTLHFSPEPTSPVSKKRPASMPPLHRRRPPQRQAFMKPDNPATPTSVLPSTATTAPPKLIAPEHIARTHSTLVKTFLQIRTLAKIDRDAVHIGCKANQPCRNYRGPAPVPSDSQALVYRDTLIDDRQVSLGFVVLVLQS